MKYPITSNLIAASAGTGKTYQLSLRFIALLALGYPAEKMIALTFTRNAAAEFRQRILTDLAKGAESDEGAQSLAERIQAMWAGDGDEMVPLSPAAAGKVHLDRKVFAGLLEAVIRKLSGLNLSTMDSFFSKLVNSHSLELGHSAIEQMDEAAQQQVRRKAIHTLLEQATGDDKEALVHICMDLQGNTKSEVFELLEKSISKYYELYQETEQCADDVWGNVEAFGVFEPGTIQVLRELVSGVSAAEAWMNLLELLDRCDEMIQEGVRVHKAAIGNRYVCQGLQKLVGGLKDHKDAPPKTLAWLYDTGVAHQGEVAELQRVARRAREVAFLVPAVMKTLGVKNLMCTYDAIYKKDVQAAGKYVFSDMPRKVAALLDTRNPANIAYRLDGRLDHWMLDEFQDTSPAQWRALRPLLDEVRSVISEDPAEKYKQAWRSLFVVGDEKQSIYGWRGATPGLFSHLRDSAEWNRILQVSTLNRSWRSADAIMGVSRDEEVALPEGEYMTVRQGFVNDLFAGVFPEGSPRRAAYTQHCIAAPNRSMKGYVGVKEVKRSDEDQLSNVSVMEVMCREMKKALEEVKFAEKKMSAAILVRSNDDVMFVYKWFREHYRNLPVMALTDEGVGSASFLGELFMHFFCWLLHPADTFRIGLLQASPLQVVAEGESIADAWRRWRTRVDELGLVSALMGLLSGLPEAKEDRAFREWVNAARKFDIAGGTADEWVRSMEHLVSKANPPKSYVHIMTYHKSKGAQYDVVFLPFNKIASLYDTGKLEAFKYTEAGNISGRPSGVLVNPRVYDKDDTLTPFNKLVAQWMDSARDEALNVLYVAVTRAKYANYIYLCSEACSTSYSGIIAEALGERRVWGDSRWYADFPERELRDEQAEESRLAAPRLRRRKVSPSKMDEEAQPVQSSRMPGGEGDAAAFGTAVHALFEQVEWLGEGEEPGWMAAPRSDEERLVAAALRVPEVRALYVRKPGQAAYNEQDIDAVQGDKWISGTLDRLVLSVDASGKVVGADIVDFKTDLRRGSSQAEQDAHLCDTHREQMRAYHTLIAAAFELAAECVSVTLVSCPRDGAAARPVCCPIS